MNYYIETHYFDHDGLVTSGGKGRDDYFEMMKRCGLNRILIPVLKTDEKVSPVERIHMEVKLPVIWRNALRDLGAGDILFIHQPPSEKFMSFRRVISEVRRRGCKVVTVIFDIETYLKPYFGRAAALKYRASLMMERSVIKNSDRVILHNEKMKEMVSAMGVDPAMIFCVGIMDYLSDEEPDLSSIEKRTGKNLPITYCGNLIPEKAGFIANIPEDIEMDIYGPGYVYNGGSNIHYKGIVPSAEMMNVISGSFGLVWDGSSIMEGKGAGGEYLRVSNPHKIALYLASGLPVIVWNQSAMADIVEHENCGITVSDLTEVSKRIDEMTEDEYAVMRNNAIKMSCGLRKGVHIGSAIESVLKSLDV